MQNKNIYIIAGIVILALIVFLAGRSKVSAPSPSPEKAGEQQAKTQNTAKPGTKPTQAAKATKQAETKTAAATSPKKLPEMDFMDKRISFPLKNYPDVKVNVEQVVFGRGNAVLSESCSGIPNANFAFLFPKGNMCINNTEVDGSQSGIVAVHLIIENNSQYGFGGNADVLRLSYLRQGAGQLAYKFARPLIDLGSYYLNPYSSKRVMLSYLVPEDQLVFNLVSGYKEPLVENRTLNVFDFSTDGLLVDFQNKILKIVK